MEGLDASLRYEGEDIPIYVGAIEPKTVASEAIPCSAGLHCECAARTIAYRSHDFNSAEFELLKAKGTQCSDSRQPRTLALP